MTRHSPIVSTVRTMRIVEELVASPGRTISELAKASGMSRAHVWKIIAGLETSGYVRQVPGSASYLLTYKLVSLGQRHAAAVRFVEICQPYLDGLAERTGELVQMGLLEGAVVRIVAKADGLQRVMVLSLLGNEVELHATAIGKAWLSTLPDDDVREILRSRELRRINSRTITSVVMLLRELRSIRKLGYAWNEEEDLEGVHAVAAPIIPGNDLGRGIGSVGVAAPIFRVPRTQLIEYAPLVKETASDLAKLHGEFRSELVISDTPSKSRHKAK